MHFGTNLLAFSPFFVVLVGVFASDAHLGLFQITLVFFEYVPMLPDEYKVTLVVKGHDAAPDKLGVVLEQRSKEPADAVPEPGGEIVQNDFWQMVRHPPVAFDVLLVYVAGYFELGRWAFR